MFVLRIRLARRRLVPDDRIEPYSVSDDCRSDIEYKPGTLFASTSAELPRVLLSVGRIGWVLGYQPIHCAPVESALRPSQKYRRLAQAQ